MSRFFSLSVLGALLSCAACTINVRIDREVQQVVRTEISSPDANCSAAANYASPDGRKAVTYALSGTTCTITISSVDEVLDVNDLKAEVDDALSEEGVDTEVDVSFDSIEITVNQAMLVDGTDAAVAGVTVSAWSIDLVAEGEPVFAQDLSGGPAENVDGMVTEPWTVSASSEFVDLVNMTFADRSSVEASVEAVIQVPLEDMPLLAAASDLALLLDLVFRVQADVQVSISK